MMGLFPDITIAVVVLVIAVVILLVARMGILPKKSLPYIAAALAGAIGIALFRKLRQQDLQNELRRQEQDLKGLQTRVQQTQPSVDAADQQLTQALADLQRQKEATQKEMLLIQANTAEEKAAIGSLQGEDLFRKYDQVFGNPSP
jgi:uncharacterized protein HemX